MNHPVGRDSVEPTFERSDANGVMAAEVSPLPLNLPKDSKRNRDWNGLFVNALNPWEIPSWFRGSKREIFLGRILSRRIFMDDRGVSFGGVRPSSGAATSALAKSLEFPKSAWCMAFLRPRTGALRTAGLRPVVFGIPPAEGRLMAAAGLRQVVRVCFQVKKTGFGQSSALRLID